MKKLTQKSQIRYELFCKVGLEMFLKYGYEKTNLNDVVKITGGSLSSLYEYFGNKEGFFEAIMLKKIEDYYQKLEKKINIKENLDLEEFLYRFANEYLNSIHKPMSIALGRIMYENVLKDKINISSILIEKNKNMINGIFNNYFKKNKIILKSSYANFAEQFCLLLREPEFNNAVVKYNAVELNKDQKQQKIKQVVELFLHGYLK